MGILLAFAIGTIVGCTMGIILLALCNVSKKADQAFNENN
jgi:ABC-type nitrate/sulfonate/bicarbonate transport system permease component